jgi:hypothetical protein
VNFVTHHRQPAFSSSAIFASGEPFADAGIIALVRFAGHLIVESYICLQVPNAIRLTHMVSS